LAHCPDRANLTKEPRHSSGERRTRQRDLAIRHQNSISAGAGTVLGGLQLEEENAKLKRLVADLSLDKTMLQDVLRRKF
jgi:hypothetical protein